jgi:hypothetical protein
MKRSSSLLMAALGADCWRALILANEPAATYNRTYVPFLEG